MGTAYQQSDWKDWFDRQGPKLFLFARQQTRSASDAEDVLQEAFIKVWKQSMLDAAVRPARFYQEIRRCAIDLARREDRRSAREEKATETTPGFADCFETSLEVEERQRALEAALADLSREQREVVALKIWGELTFEEIGEALEISPNTAASRYRYALENMRNSFNPSVL